MNNFFNNMYNNIDNIKDYDYIHNYHDDVQHIIENVTNFMNETHPLSAAYLAVTRTTSLLRHSDNTTRIMEIRDEVSSAQNRLKEFIRFNAINISYEEPRLFTAIVNTTSILQDIENNLNTEIAYRTGSYTYSRATSEEHPVFTYKNSVEIIE